MYFDDIAKNLINYLGLKIDICNSEEEALEKSSILSDDSKAYPVCFVESNTSGEKTYEEFYTEKEKLDLKKFENLGVIKNAIKRDLTEIEDVIENLQNIFLSQDYSKSEIIEILNKYLPNFKHIETGRHLDDKM